MGKKTQRPSYVEKCNLLIMSETTSLRIPFFMTAWCVFFYQSVYFYQCCFQSLFCLACFYKTKFLWLYPNAELVKYCGQPAMDLLNLVADGCIWMSDFALAKVSMFSNLPNVLSKWCNVSYFQRLEICMQIRSVNFRKFTRTWFATRVFIFRPPETLLCGGGIERTHC